MGLMDNTPYLDLPKLAKVKAAIKELNLAKRQDSQIDQLADLADVGNALGMYDAVDVIKDIL